MRGRWRVVSEQTDASLSVLGDDLDPDEITALMGHAPSRAQRQGQMMALRPGMTQPRVARRTSHVARRGLWRLRASSQNSGDLEAQISEVLAALPIDLTLWRVLTERVCLSPRVLLALVERGIAFDLDIYGPSGGANAAEGG